MQSQEGPGPVSPPGWDEHPALGAAAPTMALKGSGTVDPEHCQLSASLCHTCSPSLCGRLTTESSLVPALSLQPPGPWGHTGTIPVPLCVQGRHLMATAPSGCLLHPHLVSLCVSRGIQDNSQGAQGPLLSPLSPAPLSGLQGGTPLCPSCESPHLLSHGRKPGDLPTRELQAKPDGREETSQRSWRW